MKKLLFLGIFILLIGMGFIQGIASSCPEGYTLTQDSEGKDICRSQPEKNNQGYPIPFSEKVVEPKDPSASKQNNNPPSIIQEGNIQTNLQSKMGSSVGTTSTVSGEAKSLASGSNALYELDKKERECEDFDGCFQDELCFSKGYVLNLTYCFEGEFIPQRGWGNLCEKDFECLENFCYEGRCYRGGRERHIDSLQNNLEELENRIDSMEENATSKENGNGNLQITGAVVENFNGENTKESWIKKIWRKIFGRKLK